MELIILTIKRSMSFIEFLKDKNVKLKVSPVEPWMKEKYNVFPACKLPKLSEVYIESSKMLMNELVDINEKMIRQDERTKANNYHRAGFLDERLLVLYNKTEFDATEFISNQIHKGLIDCANTKGDSEPEYDECMKSMYQKVDEGEQEVRNIFMKNIKLAKYIF